MSDPSKDTFKHPQNPQSTCPALNLFQLRKSTSTVIIACNQYSTACFQCYIHDDINFPFISTSHCTIVQNLFEFCIAVLPNMDGWILPAMQQTDRSCVELSKVTSKTFLIYGGPTNRNWQILGGCGYIYRKYTGLYKNILTLCTWRNGLRSFELAYLFLRTQALSSVQPIWQHQTQSLCPWQKSAPRTRTVA